jgi:hypothetical protein
MFTLIAMRGACKRGWLVRIMGGSLRLSSLAVRWSVECGASPLMWTWWRPVGGGGSAALWCVGWATA